MIKILAIIPARSGSKRIAGKNVKPLCGLPLIAYTLRTARAASCFARIVVSTDDDAVAEIAREYGGDVPWLRSKKNAGDTSVVVDTIQEVLRSIEVDGDPMPDAIMLLQPTSPFRSIESIHKAIRIFGQASGNSVVSVSPAANHPWWCKRLSEEGVLLPFVPDAPGNIRSQDLPPAYALNGLIYLASIATVRQRNSLYSERTHALVIDSFEEALDIDTPFDWLVAETICNARMKGAI